MENEAYVTTYWQDFGIAEHFGASAIKDTYRQAVKCWGNNIEYMTEICAVLNHKCWQWYEKMNEFCELYSELYYKCYDYICDHFTGDDLRYFFRVMD